MILFEKTRRHPDYCVRCYLTLRCDSQCHFCSAQIPQATAEQRRVRIEPAIWAEGLNRRRRHAILAGGEPFLYDGFNELIGLLEPAYKVEIYTNLQQEVEAFLDAAGDRKYHLLISLHPGTDQIGWRRRVEQLSKAGHLLRFHIVRSEHTKELTDFLITSGIVSRYRTALQGDQRAGPKSRGIEANHAHPWVRCTSRIFLFGPDGYRYHCVHHLVRGDDCYRCGDITIPDMPIETKVYCAQFGFCAGCDNNIEGRTEDAQTASG